MAKKNTGIQVLQDPLHPTISSNQVDSSLAIFEILSEIGSAAPHLETMAKRLVDHAKALYSLKTIAFYWREESSVALTLLASSSKKITIKKPQLEVSAPSIAVNTAESGKPQFSDDESAFPVMVENRILGILHAISPQGKQISNQDRSSIQTLCIQVGLWFSKAQEMTKSGKSLNRLRSAHHISSVIQGSNPDESIGKAVHILQELHPDSKIAFLSAESKGNLRVKAYSGLTAHDTTTLRLKAGFGLAGLSAQKRKPMILHDTSEDSEHTGLVPDSRSILTAPVIFGDNLVGILNVENSQPNQFDDLDLEVLTVLADNIGAVLTNISLLNQVRDQVDQQRKLFEITDKLRSSIDRTAIMNTSVVELSKALNLHKVTLTLTSPSSETNSNEEVVS